MPISMITFSVLLLLILIIILSQAVYEWLKVPSRPTFLAKSSPRGPIPVMSEKKALNKKYPQNNKILLKKRIEELESRNKELRDKCEKKDREVKKWQSEYERVQDKLKRANK